MMAGAEVSARRQSIVKRDGTVDAATLAANERLSKMVAMQAGALGSATDGRATGTVDGGMIGKLVDWRLGVGSTPSGRGGIASGRGGMASGRAPQQPPAAPTNPYAVGAGARATSERECVVDDAGRDGELSKLALAGVGVGSAAAARMARAARGACSRRPSRGAAALGWAASEAAAAARRVVVGGGGCRAVGGRGRRAVGGRGGAV